jgi:hypothetical protein
MKTKGTTKGTPKSKRKTEVVPKAEALKTTAVEALRKIDSEAEAIQRVADGMVHSLILPIVEMSLGGGLLRADLDGLRSNLNSLDRCKSRLWRLGEMRKAVEKLQAKRGAA